jgi:hypothetical protein
MKVNELADPWAYTTWEGAELLVLHRGASRSFRENLIWLEEMTELAERFSKSPALKEELPATTLPKLG